MNWMKIILSCMIMALLNSPVARGEENAIAEGKIVKFDYTLTVEGEVADTSEGKDPLEYTHGKQMIIPGLEKQMEGLKVGDERKFTVAAEEGYGPVDERLFMEMPKEGFPEGVEPQVGMVLQVPMQAGEDGPAQQMPAMIAEVKEEVVVLNLNHPLAGRELVFDVKVVEIQ